MHPLLQLEEGQRASRQGDVAVPHSTRLCLTKQWLLTILYDYWACLYGLSSLYLVFGSMKHIPLDLGYVVAMIEVCLIASKRIR
jgi:hypothetical protein